MVKRVLELPWSDRSKHFITSHTSQTRAYDVAAMGFFGGGAYGCVKQQKCIFEMIMKYY